MGNSGVRRNYDQVIDAINQIDDQFDKKELFDLFEQHYQAHAGNSPLDAEAFASKWLWFLENPSAADHLEL